MEGQISPLTVIPLPTDQLQRIYVAQTVADRTRHAPLTHDQRIGVLARAVERINDGATPDAAVHDAVSLALRYVAANRTDEHTGRLL